MADDNNDRDDDDENTGVDAGGIVGAKKCGIPLKL